MKRAPVVAVISPAKPQRKTFPMLPWFPASFISSTRGWSVTARGVYRELIDCQWEKPEGLPADPAALQRLIGATNLEWKAAWPTVEAKFPIGSDGMRRNATVERHRQRTMERSEKAAESAKARWNRPHRDSTGGADANA